MANQIGLTNFLSFGFTLDCHFFKFSFIFYLDLSSIASSFHHFFHLPGLTSECQFGCALTLSRMFLPDWTYTSDANQTHSYPLTWTYRRLPVWLRFEVLWKFWFIRIYLLSSRRSFWSFYQVQDPSSLCIPISDKKTYIWCSMSCNVWLCMNEMLVHWFQFYVFLFIKFVTFSPMHTLRACWHSFFLLCL